MEHGVYDHVHKSPNTGSSPETVQSSTHPHELFLMTHKIKLNFIVVSHTQFDQVLRDSHEHT
jgi:hypothetical protein